MFAQNITKSCILNIVYFYLGIYLFILIRECFFITETFWIFQQCNKNDCG